MSELPRSFEPRYSRPHGIIEIYRGDRVLVLHPATCSWLVCESADAAWYRRFPELPGSAEPSAVPGPQEVGEQDYLIECFCKSNLLARDGQMLAAEDCLASRPYPLDTVVFNVTNTCNLRCKYCYADSTIGKHMPFEVIERTLAIMRPFGRRLNVQFSGSGEPLTNWPVVARSLDLLNGLRNRGVNVHITVQTNGTLVTEHIARVLSDLVDRTIVSIDGPADLTNRHRCFADGRGAFDAIRRGIDRLDAAGGRVEWSATISRVEELMPVLRWMTAQGARYLYHNCLWPQGRGSMCELPQTRAERWFEAHREQFQFLIGHNSTAPVPVLHRTVRQWVTNLVSKKRQSKCWRSPCGAGSALISVDPDGNLYPCHAMTARGLTIGRLPTQPDPPEGWFAGNISQQPLVSALRQHTVEAIPECRDCAFRYACGGPCANDTITNFGTVVNHLPGPCVYRKRIFEELMWTLADHPDNIHHLLGMPLPHAKPEWV